MPSIAGPRRLATLTLVAAAGLGAAWFGGDLIGQDPDRVTAVDGSPSGDLDHLLSLARQAEDLGAPLPVGSTDSEIGAVLGELLERHGGSFAALDPEELRAAGVEARELAAWMAEGAAEGDEFTSADAWGMVGNPDGSVSAEELFAGTADPQDASVRDIACAAELRILQTAVLLYEMDGTSPGSIDDLLGEYLETRPAGWRLEVLDGQVGYTAIGECSRTR